jgi:hypothetical protein
VLFAREALLLRGGHDFALAHKGGGAIVIIGGYAEDPFCHRFALAGTGVVLSRRSERGVSLSLADLSYTNSGLCQTGARQRREHSSTCVSG